MKTASICTKIRGASFKIALAAFAVCAAFAARAVNYWKGVDGADLATPENWSEGTLPTAAVGYFNGRSEHGTDYTATLSADTSLYQLRWGGNVTAAKSTVIDLCGHTLSLTMTSEAPIRIEKEGQSVTVTNGVLSFSSQPACVYGSNQTLTLGAGLTFNGDAAMHAPSPSTNSKIVVHDGAKVKGRIYFLSYQSEGTILVTGAGTEVDFNGGVLQWGTGTTSGTNDSFRVEDGAIVTNATVSIGNIYYKYWTSGATIALSGGGKLFTQDWNVSGGATTYIVQYLNYPAHRVEIGEGSGFHTRCLSVMGTNNVFAIDGGELEAAKYDIAGTNTFHFAGTRPKMSQFDLNYLGIGADCTFSFEIPSSGYADVPCEFWPIAAFTMPETTRLAVDATAFFRAGSGTIPLMKFKGRGLVTFSETLLSRWNTELEAKHCSVSYDTSERTLVLTVRKPGLVFIIR